MIEIANYDEFVRGLDKALDDVEFKLDTAFREFVDRCLFSAAWASPQWSGNFAANWSLGFADGDYKYEEFDATGLALTDFSNPDFNAANIWFRGGEPAIAEALRRNRDFLMHLSHTESIFLGNLTPYGEAVATNEKEDGSGAFLRAGNYIDPRPYPLGWVLSSADDSFRVAKVAYES